MFDGERLAELRKDRHLTQVDLAQILGVHRNMVSRYEQGDSIPPDEIKIKIAKYFNISLDYLMCLTKDEISYTRDNVLVLPRGFPKELVVTLEEQAKFLFDIYKMNQSKQKTPPAEG